MGSQLRSLYVNLRGGMVTNHIPKSFIPDIKLLDIIGGVDLDACLREAGITPAFLRREAKDAIRNGGQKVFAVLALMQGQPIHLITNFLKTDQMIERDLDSRLPLEHNDDLYRILGDKHTGDEFYERQWEVISPFFREDRSHRDLRHGTILPFTDSRPLREGGFGQVYEVTLEPTHHGFHYRFGRNGEIRIARKEMSLGLAADSFENEKRILRLLRQLHHENMVQLLASYSIEGSSGDLTHNLLFPLADESLDDFLKNDDQVSAMQRHFRSDDDLFQQLYGLASAIECLHHYEDAEDSLRLKGSHFDLAPRNILIHNGRLLLADFGLSRLRNETSDSCTPFRGGPGHFVAPECVGEDSAPDHRHGRPSDIWSFGGIIMVIITFMKSGPSAVERFKHERKHTSPDRKTTYRFHADGKPNPGVENWIKILEGNISGIQQGILNVARGMLSIHPGHRPSSRLITKELFLLAQQSRSKNTCQHLDTLIERTTQLRLHIERQRFTIWTAQAGLGLDNRGIRAQLCDEERQISWLADSRNCFGVVSSLLVAAKEEAEFLLETITSDGPVGPVFTRFQEINENLWNITPQHLKGKMLKTLDKSIEQLYDSELKPNTDLRSVLQSDIASWEKKATLLAAIKYMTSEAYIMENSVQSNLRIDESRVKIGRDFREHSLASVSDPSRPFLCEWVQYDVHIMDQAPERLHNRVQAVAQRFHVEPFPSEFKVLRCQGYFHSLSRTAFGLLFNYPETAPKDVAPTHLKGLMQIVNRPSLEHLFELAQTIAKCVLYFHKVGWLHKGICPHNVVFFDTQLRHGRIRPHHRPRTQPTQHQSASNPQVPKTQNAGGDKYRTMQQKWSNFLQPRIKVKNQDTPVTISPILPTDGKLTRDHHHSRLLQESRPVSASSLTARPHAVEEIRRPDSPSDASRVTLETFPTPYMIGFNHSRPNDPNTFTRGPPTTSYDYQHHRYAEEPGQRFCLGYDYYSLGLLLLEIGFWEPLCDSKLLKSDIGKTPLVEQQDIWLNEAVPRLGPPMGVGYRDAVRACLSNELLDLPDCDAMEAFETKVVNTLLCCCAKAKIMP